MKNRILFGLSLCILAFFNHSIHAMASRVSYLTPAARAAFSTSATRLPLQTTKNGVAATVASRFYSENKQLPLVYTPTLYERENAGLNAWLKQNPIYKRTDYAPGGIASTEYYHDLSTREKFHYPAGLKPSGTIAPFNFDQTDSTKQSLAQYIQREKRKLEDQLWLLRLQQSFLPEYSGQFVKNKERPTNLEPAIESEEYKNQAFGD